MPSRRTVLAAGSLALAGSAGCLGDSNPDSDDADDGTTSSHEADASEGTATNDEATEVTTTTEETTADAKAFWVTVTDDDGEVELFTGADVATVGEVESARSGGGYRMPVTLTDDGTEAFAVGLEDVGALDDPESHRVRTYFDGERLYEAKIGASLADAVESGAWDGEFLFHASDRETAEEVKDALERR